MTAAGKKDRWVKFPLWWATEAAKATNTPATLVCTYLLYKSWKAKHAGFELPNKWLEQHGVSREIKRRVLRDLEAAGLITVERTGKKSPVVRLIVI